MADEELIHLVLLPEQRAMLEALLIERRIQLAGPIPTDEEDGIPTYILSPTEDVVAEWRRQEAEAEIARRSQVMVDANPQVPYGRHERDDDEARRAARQKVLDRIIAEYEAEHGEITDEEILRLYREADERGGDTRPAGGDVM